MLLKIYADHLRDVQIKYLLNLVANVALALAVAGLAVFAVYLADQKRIVIVPTHLAAQLEVQGTSASPEYVRIMLTHFTGLLYSYTPHNIMERYKEFLAYVPAEQRQAVHQQLQQRIDQVAKLKISETFMLKDFIFLNADTCLITGRTIRWASGQELAAEDIHIKYTYSIADGGFSVEEITLLSAAEFSALQRTLDK